MHTPLERPDTVVPTRKDAELATEASRTLATTKPGAALRVRLDNGKELTLPSAAARLLHRLLAEMSQGHAVTLIPVHAELTTQEAADYLNVSRPYLIRLLETGKMAFHQVGTHRRVKFRDLEAYRTAFERDRRKAMQELAAQAQKLGMGY